MQIKLAYYPHKILRIKCEPVKPNEFGEKLQTVIKKMFEIMLHNNGIGLAASQACVAKRLFVVDLGQDAFKNGQFIAHDLINDKPIFECRPLVMINPEITWTSDEMDSSKEGCLSLPKISVSVCRPKKANVKFMDECGNEYHWALDSLLSKCAQHEIDHLNGILIIDSMKNPLNTNSDKEKIFCQLKNLEKAFYE